MENYIDFKFIMKSIWKRFYIVVILTILGGLIGFFYNRSLQITTMYEATSKIYVNPDPLVQQESIYDGLLANEKMTQNYVEIIKSKLVLEKASQQLSFETKLDDVMARVVVASIPSTSVIEIHFSDTNKDHALEMVKEVYQAFLNSNLDVENIKILDSGSVRVIQTNPRSKKYILLTTCCGILVGCVLAYGVEVLIDSKKRK